MSRPAVGLRFPHTPFVQPAAGPRFESVHDLLRRRFSFHYGVNVIGPYMSRDEIPGSMQADILNSLQNLFPLKPVEGIGSMVHP